MNLQNDLRYPIGRFTAGEPEAIAMLAGQLLTLRELPARLRAAVAGLEDAQLDTPYREQGWSLRQVVHHLADSHLNAFVRCKLALTEEWPTIKPYDEAAWARLADSQMPVALSLSLIDGLHQRWVALMESLSNAELERGFVHPERGRMTLRLTMALYAWHSLHHTAHITSLRQRMGW